MYNSNDKTIFSVELQIINLHLEWNYASSVFLHIELVQINDVILHRWSIGFRWVKYPISCTYLLLRNVFIYFITHTSETALAWILPKLKHIYEPISNQQSPSNHLSAYKFHFHSTFFHLPHIKVKTCSWGQGEIWK